MLKRIATILLALAMVFSLVALTACGDKKTDGGDEGEEAIKVGFISLVMKMRLTHTPTM